MKTTVDGMHRMGLVRRGSTAAAAPWLRRLALGPSLGVLALVAFAALVRACLQGHSGSAVELGTFVVAFAAALVNSVAGLAFSALAGAGLVHLYEQPAQAVQIMLLCSIAIQTYSVAAIWSSINWRRLAPFLPGGVACAPLGVALLSRVRYGSFALALGVFLIGYGAFMLRRRPERAFAGAWWIDALAGALGGITGALAAVPSVFTAVWCSMRGWDKLAQREVVQPYILVIQLWTLTVMHAEDQPVRFGVTPVTYMLAALSAACLGMAAFRSLSNRQSATVINLLLLVSGALMVARST